MRTRRTEAPTRPQDARAILDATITEREWQATVEQVARVHGWHCYHTFDSRRSAAGFPDLVCVKGDTILYAELKRMGGKLSAAQIVWRDALVRAGVRWYLWDPSDYDAMCAVLSGEGD